MANLIVQKGVRFTLKRFKEWLKADGKVWADIKRDEFRCLVKVGLDRSAEFVVQYLTASGKGEHSNVPHELDDVFLDLHKRTGHAQFDVGLLVNNSFDLTRRTLKASKKVYDLTGGTHHTIIDKATKAQKAAGIQDTMVHDGPLKLEVFLYDLPEKAAEEHDFLARRRDMLELTRHHPGWLHMPEGEVITHPDQLTGMFLDAVECGLEGLMVKRIFHSWVPTRCTDWMKMKPEEERDGLVVGFVPGTVGTEFEGLVGSVMFEFADGSRADASGMTLGTRLDMTEHPELYLGKIGCMKFMQRDTQGGYRHPVWVKLHEDKTEISQCD